MENRKYQINLNALTRKIIPTVIVCISGVSVLAMANEPLPPPLGFEILSKEYQVSDSECEDNAFKYARMRNAEVELASLSEQLANLDIRKFSSEEEIVSLNGMRDELNEVNRKQIAELDIANAQLAELAIKTEEARSSYRLCRETGTREECDAEYQLYLDFRAEERDIKNIVNQIQREIAEIDVEIEGVVRDIEQESARLNALLERIASTNALLQHNEDLLAEFIGTYIETGEVTTINLYGDIEPYLQAKHLSSAAGFMGIDEKRRASAGPAIGALGHDDTHSMFKGLSLSLSDMSWPSLGFPSDDDLRNDLSETFSESVQLRVLNDIENSCALRMNESESEAPTPRVALVLDEVKSYPLDGTYLVEVNISQVIASMLDLTNRYAYLSSKKLYQALDNITGIEVEQVSGNNQDELSMVSDLLKQDLLYRLVSTVGLPVLENVGQECDQGNYSPWCGIIEGWWISTAESKLLPTDIIAQLENQFSLSTSQVESTLYITTPSILHLELNAPKPVQCEEGQVLEDGVCVDIPPVCEEGEELQDGICVEIPPVCEEGQQLEDGVCVDIPLVCEEGEELQDGICVEIPPVCEDGQQLEDGVCIDIPPPACEDGEIWEDGICVELEPVCEEGEVLWWGLCVPEDWLND